MRDKTLKDIFLRSVERFAERPCLSLYEGERLTYADFGACVGEVAALLQDSGLRPGDRVALLSSNMPNWAVCYFATVISGMVIVPVLPDFSPAELDMIMAHSEVRALFVSDKLYSKVSKSTVKRLDLIVRTKNLGVISRSHVGREASQQLRKALSDVHPDIPAIPVSEQVQVPQMPPLPLLPDNQTQEARYAGPSQDDLAVIIYTSGTMSKPKGVMLTHGQLTSQVCMLDRLFPVHKEDLFLSILPLSHTYECSVGMLLPLSVGAQVVYLDKPPTPSTLMPALRRVRPTIVLSVPLVVEKIYRNQIAARFRGSGPRSGLYGHAWFRKAVHYMAGRRLKRTFGGRLRFLGIGGAKLDADTERFLIEARFPYAVGYGMTETAPLIAGAIPGKVRFRSTGPPMEGVRVRIENPDPETGDGEIVVYSPSTMKGYYKDPAATRMVLDSKGWLHTGDIGRMDEEGNLYVIGRVDNMIVGADGENIYPEEIESVINSHLMVTDSIVRQDKGRLVATVHFDPQKLRERYHGMKQGVAQRMAEVNEELKGYVNSKVKKNARISDVEQREEDFEKTPTQKIKRFRYNNSYDNSYDAAQQAAGESNNNSQNESLADEK